MMFWLFTPLLLSLVVYGMTDRQRKIQSENKHLRMHLSNDTVFDDLTNLRTMNAYQQDAEIFIGTHKRFGIPVSTGIITLRYEDQILNLLSEESKMKLIKEISKVMVASLRENDIIYNISGLNGKPKWAVLLFSKRDGVDIAIERLKKNVEKKLDEKQNLNKYDIQLKIGISEYNNDIKSVNEFIADAMQNQEYDV
jgi:GGDEF domain-containing protein